MTTAATARPTRRVHPALNLDDPMPLGVYEDYAGARHVVDYSADQEFPVQNVAIVGTELKSVATKYEVLVEHRFIERARRPAAAMPRM